MAEAAGDIQSRIANLNGKHGILGCLLVDAEGAVVASSLPDDIDTGTLGALSATLFSNNDVSIQKMNRGNLVQMTLLTDKGILHFYQAGNHILVVLTAQGQRINLEGLIRSVEEEGSALNGLVS